MSKVLVTGSAGFIAFHLIESLLRSGQAVVGIDNFDPFYAVELKEKNIADLKLIATTTGTEFSFFKINFLDKSQLGTLPSGITSVIHLGAKAGVRPSLLDPQGYVEANITGTLNMLEWCRERQIWNFVFGSSSSVYGLDSAPPFNETAECARPISPYAATKRACELICSTYAHLYPFKIASLRFFTVYGPRQRPDLVIKKFMQSIVHGETITLYGDGSSARDYTFVLDIVGGIRAALARVMAETAGFHQIYNLGGHRTTSLLQLVELLENNLGKTAVKRWEPLQPGDVTLTFANIDKAQRELKYAPQTPIQDGLKKAVEWYLGSLS